MKRGKPRAGLTDGCGSPQTSGLLGGRPFMGTGKKTTFMITDSRPEGRPHAPTHPSKSLTAGRQAGLSIASWGGVRGPFRWNFIFCIRLFVYVIKSPSRLYSCAPPARDRKPQRALLASGSVGLSMNKLELPAEFMPVRCPLADKSPIGFWIRQRPGTALGSFPHLNRAGPNRVGSLRPRIALFALAEIGKMPA